MTVNKERVQMLVDALRSGAFEQTAGCLKDQEGDCCLGVATEVSIACGLEIETDQDTMGQWYFGERQEWAQLPQKIQDWYGFDGPNPYLKRPGSVPEFSESGNIRPDEESASKWNDEVGLDFNQIADAFEETFLK